MADYFWVGGTGTYDGVATTHIAASSGGAGGAGPPVAASDRLLVDANSGGGTITITAATFPALTCTGAPVTTIAIGAATVDFKGSWALVANITLAFGANSLRCNAASATVLTWTFGGCTITGTGAFAMNAGSTGAGMTLQDSGTFPGSLGFTQGTLNLGTGNTLSVDKITGGGVTLMTLNFGTNCTLNLTSTATTTIADFAHIATAGTAGGSQIVVSTISANVRTMALASRIFPLIRYVVNGSTGGLDVSGSNTYAAGFDFADTTNARTLRFTSGTTQTFNTTNGLNAQGTSGKLMTVKAITAASPVIIALAAGKRLEVNFCSLQDLTGPGISKMFAYSSTDVSGNTLISFVTSSVSDTETGAGADTNSATTVTSSSADTGSGADTESSTSVTLSSADTGSGADTNSSTSVTLSSSETGAGADTQGATISVSFSSAETGAGVDINAATSVTLASSDTGTGADINSATTVTRSTAETGVGADANASTSVTLASADTGSGADTNSATLVKLSSAETGTGVDVGGVIVFRSSSDLGAGNDVALAVVAVLVRPSLRHIVAATDALLAMTAGQRAESVQFVVLDADLNTVGELRPGRSGMTITHDATRTLTRTLEGLFLRWDQIGDLDTLVHRIRPEWVLQNGVTFPLGVFVFAHDPRSRHALGADIHASLVDQSSLLEQSDGLPVSYPLGTNVGEAIAAEWRAAGFAHFTVDTTTATIAGPLAWQPSATRGKRMRDLSELAGFLPPYFDNNGRGVSRAAPDLSIIAARFRYLRGTTIERDSIVEDDDRLEASNRYVVVSTSGSEAPIVGKYDLPSSVPWSAARRNAVISKVVTMQGITDSVQAAAIAKSIAMSDPSLFTRVDFDAAADPRHDSWDVLTYDGNGEELAYLETAWRLELRTGGRHHHSARRSLVDA